MGVPLNQVCERGLCTNPASKEVLNADEDIMYICYHCSEKDKSREIRKIVIDPHFCSRDEYGDLITYLEDNCWDYKFTEKEGE